MLDVTASRYYPQILARTLFSIAQTVSIAFLKGQPPACVFDQAENRLHAQKALLYLLLG